jgi:ADP-dependent NAD(P)H-hydrate dehydratase / NAD(P)H-hydrate epimerase
VIPIVTPEEMAEIDRAAPEPVDVLIGRAGAAVARQAARMLGGTYGRRVVVVAGKGNNGNDGRDAARRLARRGVRVEVIDAADAPDRLPASDLVIDAAYGTGFRGEYAAPDPAGAPVLAVDIPSGVDGRSGEASETAVDADVTVTFAALKPGLVLLPGRSRCGAVVVADIGLDAGTATAQLVEPADVAGWLPARPVDAHKWQTAVWVVAGSPGMTGAALLAARGAQRAGAGYVRLSVPGGGTDVGAPVEVVTTTLPASGWAGEVIDGAERFRAFVVGPGLGPAAADDVRTVLGRLPAPVVVDGDGLNGIGSDAATLAGERSILTPHDQEYQRLTGVRPGPDRLAAARRLASATGGVALVKGSTTVVAHAGGRVLVTTTGTSALATAGTGDVLSGIIGALCAGGLDPLRAAAAGAFVHGRCGLLGFERGLVAGDLPDRLPAVFDELRGS